MAFELPPSVPDDDVILLHNILTALQSLTMTPIAPAAASAAPLAPAPGEPSSSSPPLLLCQRYKVNITPTGYLICAALPSLDQLFELTLDDMLFLQGLHPARIESISIGSKGAGQSLELFIRVLDSRQRVMVTSSGSLWFSRKRVRRASPSSSSSNKP